MFCFFFIVFVYANSSANAWAVNIYCCKKNDIMFLHIDNTSATFIVCLFSLYTRNVTLFVLYFLYQYLVVPRSLGSQHYVIWLFSLLNTSRSLLIKQNGQDLRLVSFLLKLLFYIFQLAWIFSRTIVYMLSYI